MSKFCKKCNNMLFIHSTKDEGDDGIIGLTYYCRNCDYKEEEANPKRCVYKNIHNKSNTTYGIVYNKNTRHDPTLPRVKTISCVNTQCISNNKSLKNVLIFTDMTIHNDHSKIIETIRSSLPPGCEFKDLDEESVMVTCETEEIMNGLRAQLLKIHPYIKPYTTIDPSIIFIKYDQEQLKYVYLCDYCNTSWKK